MIDSLNEEKARRIHEAFQKIYAKEK